QLAAVASLGVKAELDRRVDAIVAERTRMLGGLRAQGWTVPDSQANFVWLGIGERTVPFAEACGRAGVMVRPFAGDGVRVSVGESEATDILLEVADADPHKA
ncbi:MAG: aminotransferase, partial [Actinobacteria bacterium]|nr:aminotransferase [Actinomycetota bacterium]